MKPLAIGPDTPRSITAFDVAWSTLVTNVRVLTEADHGYLAMTARYTNGEAEDCLLAREIDLAADREADRLLAVAHAVPVLQPGLATRFLSRTAVARDLCGGSVRKPFASDADALATRVEAARFEYLSPLLLEGTLAQDLYLYGMYQHFYEEHSANEARDLARTMLHATVGDDLESILPLTTRLPWGDWFDPHSCTDRSWLIIGTRMRRAWLFAFSHSD